MYDLDSTLKKLMNWQYLHLATFVGVVLILLKLFLF